MSDNLVKVTYSDRVEFFDPSVNNYTEQDFIEAVKIASENGDKRLKELAEDDN